jgi:oligopeptide transport system substrate-binding protein
MRRLFYKGLLTASFPAVLLLNGCSDHGSKPSSPPKAHAVVKAQNVLNKGNSAEPATLDPALVEDVSSAHIVNDLFEGLTQEAPDNTIVPGVAESWDMSADAKTYTFHLRHDAKWSNGQSVTAQDFEYAIKRGMDPKTASPQSYLLYMVQNAADVNTGKMPVDKLGVKAIDPYTLQITLNAATPYFLQVVANPIAYPIYKPSIEQYGHLFTQPGHLVSDGAYKLKEWVVNDHIALVRNDQYWNNAETSIDTVNYFPIAESNSELQMYESGQLDYTNTVPSDSFQALKQKYSSELHVSPWAATLYYTFNVEKPPFNNVKLRQALSMALDRDAIANSVIPTGVIPQYSLVPKGIQGIDTESTNPDWTHWPREKQIAEAKRLYEEAGKELGYSKEHPLKITLLYNTDDQRKKVVVATQAMWHDILGVDVELRDEEWKSYLSDIDQKNFTVVLVRWIADYNDPNAFLILFNCGGSQNNGGYCNPQYDKFFNVGNNAIDSKERLSPYNQALKIAMQDYPRISIYQYVNTHLVKNYVENYQQTQVLDHVYSKNWKIKQ